MRIPWAFWSSLFPNLRLYGATPPPLHMPSSCAVRRQFYMKWKICHFFAFPCALNDQFLFGIWHNTIDIVTAVPAQRPKNRRLTLRLLMSYIYMERIFLMFLDHPQRRSTVCRTPLDEWSARRRDLYLTTHDTHNRHISMPPVGFEPTISAGERFVQVTRKEMSNI